MFELGGWDDFFVHKGYEYEYVEDRRSSEKLMIQVLWTERDTTTAVRYPGDVCL